MVRSVTNPLEGLSLSHVHESAHLKYCYQPQRLRTNHLVQRTFAFIDKGGKMFQRYNPTFALSIALLISLLSSETLAQNTSSSARPIIDVGFPDFRQTVDINKDHINDYCRFVGTAPNIFLSCQLGVKGGGFAPNPYAFNAPTGTDLGVAPRLIFPVGAVQPAFCRYIDVRARFVETVAPNASAVAPSAAQTGTNTEGGKVVDRPAVNDNASPVQNFDRQRPRGLIPALDTSKTLSCIQASNGGFDSSKEI